jgi:hypothetical protein
MWMKAAVKEKLASKSIKYVHVDMRPCSALHYREGVPTYLTGHALRVAQDETDALIP